MLKLLANPVYLAFKADLRLADQRTQARNLRPGGTAAIISYRYLHKETGLSADKRNPMCGLQNAISTAENNVFPYVWLSAVTVFLINIMVSVLVSTSPCKVCTRGVSYLAGMLAGKDEQCIALLVSNVNCFGPNVRQRGLYHLIHWPVITAIEGYQTE